MGHIRDRHPGLSVFLKKNVGRSTLTTGVPVSDRFSGIQKTIDLSPFIGDHGGVRVSKSVRSAAGNFVVELTDMIKIDAQDSIYGLVEPMDVIEIRMAGDAYKTPTMPIMMRGFVSSVRRTMHMTDRGPERKVIITGLDYGKIWQILQIFWMPNAPAPANLITSFPFFSQFGVTFNIQLMSDFIGQVFDKIVNPYIANMADISGQVDTSPLLEIQKDLQVLEGKISPWGIGAWGGSIYELLSSFGDTGAWNELFIEDREDAPYVVYRPNPFRTADSKNFVQDINEQFAPATVDVSFDDVIADDLGRSDEHVANYFWVNATRFTLNYTDTIRAFAYSGEPESFYVQQYGNVDPRLYGVRKMQIDSQQGGNQESDGGNGSPEGNARQANQNGYLGWIRTRRQQLIDQNKDNVVLEDGGFRVKGNENIKAGTYLRLTHGNMRSFYYVVSVTHDYRPFSSFITHAVVERGAGFIDRSQQGSGAASPYWGEIAQK